MITLGVLAILGAALMPLLVMVIATGDARACVRAYAFVVLVVLPIMSAAALLLIWGARQVRP